MDCISHVTSILFSIALHILEKIAMMKNSSGEDVPADTATKYRKALQFMIDFGSHIPFGQSFVVICLSLENIYSYTYKLI